MKNLLKLSAIAALAFAMHGTIAHAAPAGNNVAPAMMRPGGPGGPGHGPGPGGPHGPGPGGPGGWHGGGGWGGPGWGGPWHGGGDFCAWHPYDPACRW